MQDVPNLILIGPMGAGKSTIGRLLAAELSRPFYDSDHEIQARCGADIPWIFDVEGESGFRDRESSMISELVDYDQVVIATGGGAVLREENRQCIREGGTVIYLYTTVEQQLKRTAKDRNRPLLQRGDREQLLRDMFALRDPLYRATADLVVRTDRRGPRSVVNDIVRRVHRLLDPLTCKASS
ncbi:shikimate kinase AroK [Halomonas denitrificans]|uniref:shikimate kinase AroK n=1 Tax=Halomonas TaxID=2745 RepID=UPI001A8F20F9|nr:MULTISPECIES: shikimate kinase AroK [Halomonas]MBN8411781.1 shikimate kinase AroK [Halomonas litopenaei]MBY5923708.1 shikimate kinase AroK [Halomonas sp. DP4Y7-2]MBY5927854.1 shikimate kinase AroK [Halomonas sp. DP8Y7-3]MBY5967595.1 shikimate kinase AroK [Halomonas denitrificans]MBY5983099.1 shikimate kinase AroK [Halomonas sp. DP5Y7-2]